MLLENIRVLVIDDVNSVRVHIRQLLKQSGFKHIELAPDISRAKELLKVRHYELILADLHMKPENGLDLLKYVRNHPTLATACFIMITADNTRDSVITSVASGVDSYLLKPVTPENIETKVYATLLKKGLL